MSIDDLAARLRRRARNSATAAAPEVTGYVDEPQPGDLVAREAVRVRGWHLCDGQAPAAVAASVDGRVVAAGAVGAEARPDVADALGRAGVAGWSMVADLSTVTGDKAELTISVWPSLDAPPVHLPPFAVLLADPVDAGAEVGPDTVLGTIDSPPDGVTLPRTIVPIAGWALTPAAPVSGVEVFLDGTSAGRARLGLPRPDVSEQQPEAHGGVSGYEALLDLSTLGEEVESVTVEVVAHTADGAVHDVAGREYQLADADVPRRRIPGTSADALLRLRAEPSERAENGLNLVVFTHDLGYGGGQLWLSELLRVMRAGRDFRCTVVSPSDGPLRAELERDGIAVHVTQDVIVHDLGSYEGRLAELAMVLRGLGANAVLVNTMGQFAGADLADRLGLPAVWAIHESFTLEQYWYAAFGVHRPHPGVRQAAARALRNTAAVVFEAERTRSQYLDAARPEHCLVVRYGIDTKAISSYLARNTRAQARERLGVPAAARLLVVMGTTEPRKAQTMIAEAFAALGQARGDALLAFVGDTGSDYADGLRRYLDDSGLGDCVRLVKVTSDTYSWYRAADVLVSGSDIESLPRSALESMCFGVPVLATAVFGLPELISDRVNGFLCEPRDLHALTEALRQVVTMDAAELAHVGDRARRHVLDHFDSAGYAADFLALLNGLRHDPDALPGTLLQPR